LARTEIAIALEHASPGQALEVAAEVGQLEGFLGESSRAWPLLESVTNEIVPGTDHGEQGLLTRALLRVCAGDATSAFEDVVQLRYGQPRTAVAFEARRHLTTGLVLAMIDHEQSADAIRLGTSIARDQGAALWVRYGSMLGFLADRSDDPSGAVMGMAQESSVVLSMLAEAILMRMPDLNTEAVQAVTTEAQQRPWRWRPAARRLLGVGHVDERHSAARLLGAIGEIGDIKLLREASKTLRDRSASRLGYELARRLARPVYVEDLGRIRVMTGERTIEGGDVRRKVLALLCLLLSKARFSSTRDEVVDSLWPDHDPQSALNSLNQTVYFLRRVFEPDYDDATSPGYVGQDGETIWLDPDLVDSRSRRCLEIIRSMPGSPTPEGSLALAHEYQGRFALDFAYEQWSVPYRDSLHASYLRVMEHAVRMDLDAGHFGRGTFLAERAAEVDPEAEEIQVALVRLYRLSGAHAAAAEQYGHYVHSMRELGVEPVALADL
jgi:DNA-binding SARP family transcriptional activator